MDFFSACLPPPSLPFVSNVSFAPTLLFSTKSISAISRTTPSFPSSTTTCIHLSPRSSHSSSPIYWVTTAALTSSTCRRIFIRQVITLCCAWRPRFSPGCAGHSCPSPCALRTSATPKWPSPASSPCLTLRLARKADMYFLTEFSTFFRVLHVVVFMHTISLTPRDQCFRFWHVINVISLRAACSFKNIAWGLMAMDGICYMNISEISQTRIFWLRTEVIIWGVSLAVLQFFVYVVIFEVHLILLPLTAQGSITWRRMRASGHAVSMAWGSSGEWCGCHEICTRAIYGFAIPSTVTTFEWCDAFFLARR